MVPSTSRPTHAWRAVRRAVLRRRRLLAAVLTAVVVASGLSALTAPAPPAVAVTVAARDLPAGAVLTDGDLASVGFAPGSAPEGLADDAVGAVLAAPLRRGEPVTDVRLVGPELTAGREDLVAVPVRLPDAAMVGLLEVGDRVDLVATDPQEGGATEVAGDVMVLAIPAADAGESSAGLPGRLVVVGVGPDEVAELTDATVRLFVTYTWSSR